MSQTGITQTEIYYTVGGALGGFLVAKLFAKNVLLCVIIGGALGLVATKIKR